MKHQEKSLTVHQNKIFNKILEVAIPYGKLQDLSTTSTNFSFMSRAPINLLFSVDQFFSEFSKKYPQRSKSSDFKLQLREQKKISIFYGGLTKKQLTKIVTQATSYKGQVTKNILSLLERRLDVVLFRSNFTKNVVSSRQLITHKKILINNKYMTSPSYMLRPGDIISVSPEYIKNMSRSLRDLLKNKFKIEENPYILPLETLNKWDNIKSSALKCDIDLFVQLILKKLQIKLKNKSFQENDLSQVIICSSAMERNQYIWDSKDSMNKELLGYYRNILLNLILDARNASTSRDFFMLILRTHLLKKRSKQDVLVGLQCIGRKPLHLEISYKLLTIIFLYSPQRIYYPFCLDLDLLRRSCIQ